MALQLSKLPLAANTNRRTPLFTSTDRRTHLSTSTDPALATDVSYMTWSWVGEFDHTTNVSQTSAAIPLVAGNFYYLNLSYKNPTTDDYGRYAAHWKTPFQDDDNWRFIDDHYLYGYACETICPPMGTACNDNDPMTFADKYDDNCNCAGVPCSDPACSNDINYTYRRIAHYEYLQ